MLRGWRRVRRFMWISLGGVWVAGAAGAAHDNAERHRFSFFLDNLQIVAGDDWFGNDEPYLVVLSASAKLDGSAPKVRLERFQHGNVRSGENWAVAGRSYRFTDSAPIEHRFDTAGPPAAFSLIVAVMEQDTPDGRTPAAVGQALQTAAAAAFRSGFAPAAPPPDAREDAQVAEHLTARLEESLERLDLPRTVARVLSGVDADNFAGFFTVAAVSLPSGRLLASVAPGEALEFTPFREWRRGFTVDFPVESMPGVDLVGRYALHGWMGLQRVAEADELAGVPSLIQSRFGIQGNFELLVPASDGRLRHYWRNNDAAGLTWGGPALFGTDLGRIDAVSVVQSTFGSVGNLEAVARAGDRLLFFWRPSDPGSDWRGPIEIGTGASGAPALIQSTFGNTGNFELVAPAADGGLRHYSRDNDAAGYPWSPPAAFGRELGRVNAVSLIQSRLGNLEVVARAGDRLYAFRRPPEPGAEWQGPVEIASGVNGNPSLIQSRHGARGAFELVVPAADGGLRHYWRNDDTVSPGWSGPIAFGQELGGIDAASLVQSNLGSPGNLEVVARSGDRLFFLWRGPERRLAWSRPSMLATPR